MCFGLPCGGLKVQTQQMKYAQKWPDVGGGDGLCLKLADDLLQFATITDRCFRDETLRRQPSLELRPVTRRARAVEKANEMLQEGVGSAQSDEDEAILRRAEPVGFLEVVPEVANSLPAIVVRGAHSETPLDLAGKLPGAYTGTVHIQLGNRQYASRGAQFGS